MAKIWPTEIFEISPAFYGALTCNINTVKEIFTFDPINEKAFLENIKRNGKTEELLDYLNQIDINREQIENGIGMLNDILLTAAKKYFMFKKAIKEGRKKHLQK